jgi:hypothetical protein
MGPAICIALSQICCGMRGLMEPMGYVHAPTTLGALIKLVFNRDNLLQYQEICSSYHLQHAM